MVTSPEIARIEGGPARTRARMATRIDELQRHLTPRQMLNDALVGIRGGRGADFTDDLGSGLIEPEEEGGGEGDG